MFVGVTTAGGAQTRSSVGPLRREVTLSIGLFSNGALRQLLGKAINAVEKTSAAGTTRARGSGHTFEGVVLLVNIIGRLRQRRARLVVGEIRLSGVREERDNGSDTLGRANLASRDHDAELHEMVVDAAGAGLDDVDILSTNGILDLAAGLASGEFGEDAIARGYTEDIADTLGELRVGVASQQNNVANHCGVLVEVGGKDEVKKLLACVSVGLYRNSRRQQKQRLLLKLDIGSWKLSADPAEVVKEACRLSKPKRRRKIGLVSGYLELSGFSKRRFFFFMSHPTPVSCVLSGLGKPGGLQKFFFSRFLHNKQKSDQGSQLQISSTEQTVSSLASDYCCYAHNGRRRKDRK